MAFDEVVIMPLNGSFGVLSWVLAPCQGLPSGMSSQNLTFDA